MLVKRLGSTRGDWTSHAARPCPTADPAVCMRIARVSAGPSSSVSFLSLETAVVSLPRSQQRPTGTKRLPRHRQRVKRPCARTEAVKTAGSRQECRKISGRTRLTVNAGKGGDNERAGLKQVSWLGWMPGCFWHTALGFCLYSVTSVGAMALQGTRLPPCP